MTRSWRKPATRRSRQVRSGRHSAYLLPVAADCFWPPSRACNARTFSRIFWRALRMRFSRDLSPLRKDMESPPCDATAFVAAACGTIWTWLREWMRKGKLVAAFKLNVCGRENRNSWSASTLGGSAATSGAPRARATYSTLRGSFQLLHLGELACCHLHHQIEDCLLSDFANLYELHGAKIIPLATLVHPLEVAGMLPRRR